MSVVIFCTIHEWPQFVQLMVTSTWPGSPLRVVTLRGFVTCAAQCGHATSTV